MAPHRPPTAHSPHCKPWDVEEGVMVEASGAGRLAHRPRRVGGHPWKATATFGHRRAECHAQWVLRDSACTGVAGAFNVYCGQGLVLLAVQLPS